ncbi:MAG TPA: glycosyltransferase family 1 protein [Tepidisphaeraceae bacterium]|nr:glycosyltransferase family 1 protein [Tepidisphaeraceae bacterium]
MRIGVNAFPLRVAVGGARYAFWGLMRALLNAESENQYVIFSHPRSPPIAGAKVVPIRNEEEIQEHAAEFDLFFGPLNELRPRIYDSPTVALLADIQQEYFPQYFSYSQRVARREAYLEICRAATKVVTVSQFSKESIIDKFGVDGRKIEVVFNAPQDGLVDGEAMPPCADLPEEYFFYPANFYPHKNHAMLLDAIARLDPGTMLVFVGSNVPGGFPLKRQIERRKLSARCRVLENLSAAQMQYLYRHARATVMPTCFEGFGMPAVESMACGCPLICSDIPPLRELAGDDALYFPLDDPARLCEQMRTISSDAELRRDLSERGRQRATQFSWQASARRMLEVFKRACEQFKSGYDRPQAGVSPPRIGISRIESPAELLEFARRENFDLVGQLAATDRLCPSAMDSLALAWRTDAGKALVIGEVRTWRRGKYTGVSRLRQTGDDMWKLEGQLYPPMLFIAPAALAQWPAGLDILRLGGTNWRWDLLRAGFRANQIALVRRTLADCQWEPVGWLSAMRSGIHAFYRCGDGARAPVPVLRKFEETARRLSQSLPVPLQKAGATVWYRVTR